MLDRKSTKLFNIPLEQEVTSAEVNKTIAQSLPQIIVYAGDLTLIAKS